MDAQVPTAEDHCRIVILVRTLGYRSATTFNHLIERLGRVEAIQVSENPKRIILAKFVTSINPELCKFGELQAHRKIFGFIGVAQCPAPGSIPSTSTSIDDDVVHEDVRKRSEVCMPATSLDAIREQYNNCKQELSGALVDSRCLLLGFRDTNCEIEPRELLIFPRLEESDEFENAVRELIRSIYFVIESRRIDLSFEKMETPPCPTVPEEEKTRVGTENRQSKTYKRKCIGRLRKQVADYTLLTGLPSLALDSYLASIEALKQSMDLLWLAAAYEGYACAAMAIRYNETADRLRRQAVMHRVATMTPDQIRETKEKAQHNLGGFGSCRVTIGHQRYRSDDDQRALATAAAAAAQLIEQDIQQRKQIKKPWAIIDRSPSGKNSFDYLEIIEKFRLALENYERFSFAAFIEYECMVRAASVYRHQRMFIETENFMREHVGKYLDDGFTLFDNVTKAQICMVYAQVYRDMGFHRKQSFFSRLAVLFRLHVNDNDARTEHDYKLVYPILYRTLPGYGIVDNVREGSKTGPVAVQVKAVHEVYMSALRANFCDAAVRHLCYILQVYLDELEAGVALKMLEELTQLVRRLPRIHSLAQCISLDQSGILLPPLQMTKFPTLSDFKIVKLPKQLAPRVISIGGADQKIFIYSPFQNDSNDVNEIHWVSNCACEVSVKVLNPLPIDLVVKNLALLAEGCYFEAVPVRLTLGPYTPGLEPTEIKLLGVPREPGRLTITGYSCEVLGVRNVCSIKEILPRNSSSRSSSSSTRNNSSSSSSVVRLPSENGGDSGVTLRIPSPVQPAVSTAFTVDVLCDMPLMELETSLQRVPTTQENAEPVSEATVFSGQTFVHSVSIVNTHTSIGIRSIKLSIRQPTTFGMQLIELLDLPMTKLHDDIVPSARINGLDPGERREIRFQLFGVDPASLADDKLVGGEQKVLIMPAAASTPADDGCDASSRDSLLSVDGSGSHRNSVLSFTDESVSAGLGGSLNHDHNLIPYTGRLLTAELVFRYVADIEGPDQATYERTATLPLAICIVPAVTVSSWHILPGDSPSNRFVVIDVTNSTDLDAELTFSTEKRLIDVQPKKACRVPVLCPCCPDVSSRAFHEATQHDSHYLQKQKVDILRRSLDTHIANHLQIRWAIPQLNYSGIVPIGSVLAEVEFLKQLVVPTVSVYMSVNNEPFLDNDGVGIGIGKVVELQLTITSVLKAKKPITGEIFLRCFQDLGGNQPYLLDRPEAMVLCGPIRMPVTIDTSDAAAENKPCTRTEFAFLFLYEGTYKIRPQITKADPALAEDEIFVPTVTFTVRTEV